MATVITNDNINDLVKYYINNEFNKLLPNLVSIVPLSTDEYDYAISTINKLDIDSNSKETLKQNINDNSNKITKIPINDWDVSRVTNMQLLFHEYTDFNESINNWDAIQIVFYNPFYNFLFLLNDDNY